MRVHLRTLGCRLNEAELEQWANGFRRYGHTLADQAGDADVLVVNTCAVTADAVRKSRNLVRRAHRESPKAKLIVTGCHAALSPQNMRDELGADLVVGNQDKDRLVAIAVQALDLPAMPEAATEPAEVALFQRGRQRAFVKVQDGCRYRCAYCIVTVARGAERSRPIADVVAEVNRLYQQGLREIVITGVQVGGYGHGAGETLPGLLRALLADTDMPRIRLGSVEPWSIGEDFIEAFANPSLLPHLHLPLQSGSDAVLRRMARATRIADYRALATRLRAAIPSFNLTSDIIVGFPGETETEWEETLAAVRTLGFGHLHIFSYSDREGTKAARLPDKVPDAVKKRRSRALHALAEDEKRAVLASQAGASADVLFERAEATQAGRRRWFGYTPNFLRVGLDRPESENLENRILNVRLTRVEDGILVAEQ